MWHRSGQGLRRASLAAALLAAGLAPAAASAQELFVNGMPAEQEGYETRVVRYADLNLASPEGARSLARRVHAAVHGVCLDSLTGFRDLETRIAERSEGLPVLVVEYLTALAASADETNVLDHVPPGAAELLRARLGEVDALGRQVLGAAAIMGRTFDAAMIQRVSRRTPDETVRVIEAAVGAGLIAGSAAGEERYDFHHEAIRQQLLADMTPARRRLLHLRLADLAEDLPGPAGERAGLVARHAEAAGDGARAARAHR
ncbi:MAG TPA: UrcA family protein, partial [Solirubrobacterales bacterium]|nr:UrcA family protein [Solirubrobacterales bacterium]